MVPLLAFSKHDDSIEMENAFTIQANLQVTADGLSSIPLFDEEQGVYRQRTDCYGPNPKCTDRDWPSGVDHEAANESSGSRDLCTLLASCVLADFDADKRADRKQRSALLLAIGKSPPPPIADILVFAVS